MRTIYIDPRRAICADIERPDTPDEVDTQIVQALKAGKITALTLPSGDRLLCATASIVARGARATTKQEVTAAIFGRFAVLDEPVTVDMSNPDQVAELLAGFSAKNTALTEIIGTAQIIGPVDPEDPYKFTAAVSTEDQLNRIICWSAEATKRMLTQEILELEEYDEEELIAGRADSTDEELIKCGCPGCLAEVERRTQEASGLRMRH